MPDGAGIVGILYLLTGALGVLCNSLVVCMIFFVPKSAYILMANIAVADAIQSFIVGGYTGFVVLQQRNIEQHQICVLTITGWFVMIYSYAILGINRCVSTCFYKTKLRKFNRLRATRFMIMAVWIASLAGGFAASFPEPILFVHTHIWTMRFRTHTLRGQVFVLFNVIVNAVSIVIQWICSLFVLCTVRAISKRISNNTISTTKLRRSQKQARLSFQFFYPSVVCTLSSIMFFSMPLYAHLMTRWHFFFSHLVWLFNHMCNPFFYLYFNGRMRETVLLWMRCEPDHGHSIAERAKVTMGPTSGLTDRRSTRDQTTFLNSSSGNKKLSLPTIRVHTVANKHRQASKTSIGELVKNDSLIAREDAESVRKLTL